MIDERTFGASPAAMYLARQLEGKPQSLRRKCAAKIVNTQTQVKEILSAVGQSNKSLSLKTAAHMLSLLRTEVTNDTGDKNFPFEENLRRNVQIGAIKHGLHHLGVIGSWNRGMYRRAQRDFDEQGDALRGSQKQLLPVNIPDNEYHIEVLNQRSLARCTRQGKPHTKV